MTKVLVPVEGSESSLRALRYAMGVADELHIVNVQPRADTPTLLLHITQEAIDRAQMEHGRSMLSEACKLLDEAGRSYRSHVLIGDPAATIELVATSEGVDAIVMGTRGMGAFGNLALGSTATKVVHLAKVPVTLVK
jgi:nucleotide-binding universal stress UspA family protein